MGESRRISLKWKDGSPMPEKGDLVEDDDCWWQVFSRRWRVSTRGPWYEVELLLSYIGPVGEDEGND